MQMQMDSVWVRRVRVIVAGLFLMALLPMLLAGCAADQTVARAFESLEYQKSGGFAGISETMHIDAQGQVAINGQLVARLDETFADVKRDAAAVAWGEIDDRRVVTKGAADLFVYRIAYVTRAGEKTREQQVVIDEMQLAGASDQLRVLVRSLEAMYGRLKGIRPTEAPADE